MMCLKNLVSVVLLLLVALTSSVPTASAQVVTAPPATLVICANGATDECMKGCDSPRCRAWYKVAERTAAVEVAKETAEFAKAEAEAKAEAAALKGAAKTVKVLCTAKVYVDAEVECSAAEDWDSLRTEVLEMAKEKFSKSQAILEGLAFDADGTASVDKMGSKPVVLLWLPPPGGWRASRPAAKPTTAMTTPSAPRMPGHPPVTVGTITIETATTTTTSDPNLPCEEQEVDCRAVKLAVWPGRDCTKPLKVQAVRPEEWAVCQDQIETFRGGYCKPLDDGGR